MFSTVSMKEKTNQPTKKKNKKKKTQLLKKFPES
jgi:hypothetical protein